MSQSRYLVSELLAAHPGIEPADVTSETDTDGEDLDMRTLPAGSRVAALVAVSDHTDGVFTFTMEDAPDSTGSAGSYEANPDSDSVVLAEDGAGIVSARVRTGRPWVRVTVESEDGSEAVDATVSAIMLSVPQAL